MLVKAGIFNGKHGVFHDLRNFFDGCEIAPLFTKFAHQHAVSGVNAQRQLGAVIGQIRDVGKLGVCHDHGHAHHHQDRHQTRNHQTPCPKTSTQRPMQSG